jgi:hypothetical protein
VTQFLSPAVAPALVLPPVVTVGRDGLRLSAEARIAIRRRRGHHRPAVERARAPVRQPRDRSAVRGGGRSRRARAVLRAQTETLVACYGDLVAALRGRAGELHGALTTALAPAR